MAQTVDGDHLEDLVGRAVEEYLQSVERGEEPQLEDFVERYSEIGDILRTVIPAFELNSQPCDTSVTRIVGGDHHKQIGDFRVLRLLGRGGMGIVYEAEQISMKRRVALKLLPLAGLVDDAKIRRFHNEVRAVAALDHPNIVSVYMVGEERGVHYYAMQLIRGRSLAEVISSLQEVHGEGDELNGASMSQVTRIGDVDDDAEVHKDAKPNLGAETDDADGRQHGPDVMPADTGHQGETSTIPHSSRREYFRSVVALGIQAAAALQHAHDEGIVHRDVKPANLMLDSSAKLYLTDFGLARIEADAGVTMTGDLIGTLRYMAPEQALAKRVVVDHRADIYSLAATLYELLTLQPAYAAEDRQQLLKQIAFEEPTPLRRVVRDIPAELETIVHKAMSKDMDQRYSSAQEMADDLRSHLENRPIKAKPPTTSEIIGKWTRRNPAVTWATVVTLLLVTIVLAASTLFYSKQLRRTSDAEQKTNEARNDLATRASELARHNYLLNIASADNALLRKKYSRARAALDACPPSQRGWEWDYHNERIRTAFPFAELGANERLHRDGKRLTAVTSRNGLQIYSTFEHSLGDDSESYQVTTWDLESGKIVHQLDCDVRPTTVAISNNERWLAISDLKGNLSVLHAESGKELWSVDTRVEDGLDNRIGPLKFSPDDSHIACAYQHRKLLVVFDATNGEEHFTVGDFGDTPGELNFSPNGRWLASGTGNGVGPARLIDVETGETVARVSQAKGSIYPTFDPPGKRIATANLDGWITIWGWDDRRLDEITSWRASTQRIRGIAFSADGARLVSSDRANTVKVWNVATHEPLANLESQGTVYGVKFRLPSEDSTARDEQVLVGSVTLGTRLWRWDSGQRGTKVKKPLNGAVEARFSPDGQFILASTPMYFTGGNTYYHRHPYYVPEPAVILSAESGERLVTINEAIYAASWSLDGKEIVATPAAGDTIRTFNAASGARSSRNFSGHTGRFTISRVSPESGRLVSFSNDKTIRAFDFESGEAVLMHRINVSLGKTTYHGTNADFSPDAKLIELSGGIIDTQSGSTVSTHSDGRRGHWPKRAVFSNDSKYVYLGCSGGLLIQLDTATGRIEHRFDGHSGNVIGIAIAPDGKNIVSGDRLGRVTVWDVAGQAPLVTLSESGPPISSLDWSSDGRRIVAGKEVGTVQIWTLPRTP